MAVEVDDLLEGRPVRPRLACMRAGRFEAIGTSDV
jgi:hypothetical protein